MIQAKLNGLVSETRGQVDHLLSNHIYVCAHPEQLGQVYHFAQEQILPHGATFVLWSYRNSENQLTEADADELCNAIGQMELMVLLVTKRFLYEPNRARDLEFAAAREHGIPILPFLLEAGLEEDFNEYSDGLQALIPGGNDATEMSMDQKANFMLRKLFMPTELMEKLDGCFAARLFLSYRKKDRAYANALMQYIHHGPRFEGISIWYDEFLPVGERFEAAIEAQMQEADAVLLMITPSILEEGNYVLTTEYLMAWKLHKPIIPVLVTDTDVEMIRKTYTGLPEIIDARAEGNELHAAVLEAITVGKTKKQEEWDGLPAMTPEQMGLLAECYLLGYKVEQNKEEALALFEEAARKGDAEATERLVEIYSKGLCAPQNLGRAIAIQQNYLTQKMGEARTPYGVGAMNAEGKILANLYAAAGSYEAAYQTSAVVHQFIEEYAKVTGEQGVLELLPATEVRMAQMLVELGRFEAAVNWAEHALPSLLEANEPSLSIHQSYGAALQAIIDCYHTLMIAFRNMGDTEKARSYTAQIINYRTRVDQEIPGTGIMHEVYKEYAFLGDLWAKEQNGQQALFCYNQAGGYLQRLVDAGFMQDDLMAREIFENLVNIDVCIGELYLSADCADEAKTSYRSAVLRLQNPPEGVQFTENLMQLRKRIQEGLEFLEKMQ